MKLLPAAVLFLATLPLHPLSAQSGTHDLFGFNCPGTGDKPGTPCIRSNDIYKAGAIALFSGNQYAIQAKTGAKACTVTGFELQHATMAGHPVWVRTWLYSAKISGAPDKIMASGIMVIGTTLGWCRTSFPPVQIPPKTTFFLVYDSPSQARIAPASIAQLGKKVPAFRGRNQKWTSIPPVKWVYRVNSGRAAGGGRPLLTSTSVPTLGKVFTAQVHYIPLTPPFCFHLLGFSNTRWAGLNLPFDLTPLGATGCRLNVSIARATPIPISPITKAASLKLPIPNNPVLLGASFFHQVMVQDAKANPLGFTFSNGGKGVLGK